MIKYMALTVARLVMPPMLALIMANERGRLTE